MTFPKSTESVSPLTWRYSKESSLRVDCSELPILIKPHPRNIITNTGNLVIWQGRFHHS